MRIAISGVGTSVGIGIIKSIRKDSEEHFILGIDNVKSAQSFMVNKFEFMGKVEFLENCDHIINLINLYTIDVLLISSEYEISWFSKNKELIELKTNAKLLVCPEKWIDLGNDKLETYFFLKKIKVPVAPFFYFDLKKDFWISGIDYRRLESNDFPIFAKPKYGTSNKGIRKFEDICEFENYSMDDNINGIVLQKSLALEENFFEVTSSIVISRKGEIVSMPFHAKRILNKGISWEIEKFESNQLDQIVLSIAKNMEGYLGSLNIQFMGSEEKGFYPLEINTRFSGTTSFRTACGINEVMYLSYDLMNKENKDLLNLKTKGKFPKMYRYIEDYIIQ